MTAIMMTSTLYVVISHKTYQISLFANKNWIMW